MPFIFQYPIISAKNSPKNSKIIPKEFKKNPKEFPKNFQRIPSKNSKKKFTLKVLIIPAILNSRLEFEIPFELVSLKSRPFGLGQTNWTDKFWDIWGIFGRTISTHFGTVSPLSLFSFIQPLFLQLSLYIHIPNIHLGLGLEFEFEFGPQSIRNLAFVCPYSMFLYILWSHILMPMVQQLSNICIYYEAVL